MFCKKCGAELIDGALFCTECGTAVNANTDEKTVSPSVTPVMLANDDDVTVVIGNNGQIMGDGATERYNFGETVPANDIFDGIQPGNGFPPPAPQPPAPKKKKKTALIIILVIVAVTLLFLIGAVILFFVFKDSIKSFIDESFGNSAYSEKADNDDDQYGIADDTYEEVTYYYDSYDKVTSPEIETLPEWTVENPDEPTLIVTQPPATVFVPPTQAPTRPPVTERVTQPATQPPSVYGGLNSSDPAEIASFYETAARRTYNVSATQFMSLNGDISGDGAIGAILTVLQPTIDQVLAENTYRTNSIPGAGVAPLYSSDIKSASAISNGGRTTVTIYLKEQVDGPDGDSNYGGPVARGIGTLGSIDNVLNELGADITSGRDTVSLTYRDAYIRCVIDNETGEIVSGTWFWTVDVFVGYADVDLGISVMLKNLGASVNYKVIF